MTYRDPHSQQPIDAANAILENLLDAVLVVDARGLIIYANRSAYQLFQKSSKELINQPFGFPVVQNEVQEINLVKQGQVLTVQMLASPIQWNDKKASLLSLRDISDQKKLMKELEEQKGLLEKMNEENAQYASLASHDLKEPVRKILVFTDLLLRHDGRPSRDQEMIQKINSSAAKMNRLINGIAELSRVSYVEHSFKEVDLEAIVIEVREDLELLLLEKEGRVESHSLPVIEAVPDKMYQLFLNLISNSLKYSREGIKPFIRISSKPLDDDIVQITFQDNGIGFDNSSASQLFQPFRRLHKTDYDGIGIGLSLCHRIVEMHGGEIKAEGAEGQGAAFIIQIPKHQSAKVN